MIKIYNETIKGILVIFLRFFKTIKVIVIDKVNFKNTNFSSNYRKRK